MKSAHEQKITAMIISSICKVQKITKQNSLHVQVTPVGGVKTRLKQI